MQRLFRSVATVPERFKIDLDVADFVGLDTARLSVALGVAMCAGPFTTRVAAQLLSAQSPISVHRSTLVRRLIKATLFRQFVGGENHHELQQVVCHHLERNGVGAILDFAVERDLSPRHAETASAGHHLHPTTTLDFEHDFEHDAKQLGVLERFDLWDAAAARYDSPSERFSEDTLRILADTIEMAGALPNSGFIAIKVTALARPDLLRRTNEYVCALGSAFHECARSPGRLDLDGFWRLLQKLGIGEAGGAPPAWPPSLFQRARSPESQYLSLEEVLVALNPALPLRTIFGLTEEGGAITLPSRADAHCSLALLRRLQWLAQLAKRRAVSLLVDAEQSYFQEAISLLARDLMREFNSGGGGGASRPVIYNTYQCYLKSTDAALALHLADAAHGRRPYAFAAKLVRGAYLVQEKALAATHHGHNLLHESIHHTAASYDACATALLHCVAEQRAHLLVATHNEDSTENAANLMCLLNIGKDSQRVHFAQLYGMADHITDQLARSRYRVCKYVPFGPLDEVLPYLLRRTQENASVVEKNAKYIMPMARALCHRCLFRATSAAR